MTTARNRLALAASAIALSLAVPLLASAQTQGRIAGTVADFHGKYGLVVRDARGGLTEVTLHQGTIIKPVGLRLERGMKVMILGQGADQTFAAVEIVAPFEQVPSARALANAAAIARASSGADQPNSLSPNRDTRGDRWTEYPGQYSIPAPVEPRDPH
jgi:hypothetical protein